MVGEAAFEQARGVVMEACDCSADNAIVLMTQVARTTDQAPADLVETLRTPFSRVELLRLLKLAPN